MTRPLVLVVFYYAVGLLLGELYQPPLTALFVFAFSAVVTAIAFKKLRSALVWPSLVLVGWTNLVFHTTIIAPNDLRAVIRSGPALATIRGKVIETPLLKIVERNNQETEHSLAEVSVSALRLEDDWQPAYGIIMVSTPDSPGTNFFAGQRVEISGVIAQPAPPLAEGLFDYRDYLKTRGIYFELKVQSANDWQLSTPALSSPPLADRFLNWSRHTLALGLPVEDEPLRLLWAMTLGWRTAFTGDISEPFLQAGTMHMFAIDGLRIALCSAMLVALMRLLQISRAWCGVIAIPLIWFYTAATGWETSAMRASLMMTIVLGGWALKRPGDLLNSLALAAFIILLGEPRQLFEASFQLSFFVMLTIALMLPPLNDLFNRWLQHDPLLPEELIPGWRMKLSWMARKLARYSALSLAAWIGSVPLSIKYFHLFSLVSTPANIIAVPLGTFALMANLGALITGNWLPWATELFNQAAWFFMVAMTWVSVNFAKLPGAFFYVPDISWFTVAAYYAVVIMVFSGWLRNLPWRIFGGVALSMVVGLYFFRWEKSRSETDLTILPLNGGHAIFVDAGDRRNKLLVDCGNERAAEGTLKDFLRAHGVNSIPQLVLTTGAIRNSGGATPLDQIFGVDELWTSNVKFRSHAYWETVSRFESPAQRHKILSSGGSICSWDVLYPDATNNFSRADDNTLVLRGNFNRTKILLLSDLSRAGQDGLLSSMTDLRADIVVAGLPGEGEPLCTALIDAVQPHAIIIADSELPVQRRASRGLRARLQNTDIPVIYTRDSGAVTIVVQRDGWHLHAMDGSSISVTK
jgi:competence protein ComEC